MKRLLMLAVLLLPACGMTPKKPIKPQYVYMILDKGKLKGYPVRNLNDAERDISTNDMIGAMCLPLDDWQNQERYIIDLEKHVEGEDNDYRW